MAEQQRYGMNWSVQSDSPNNSQINPISVSRGAAPVRSRNQSSTNSSLSLPPNASPRMQSRHSSGEQVNVRNNSNSHSRNSRNYVSPVMATSSASDDLNGNRSQNLEKSLSKIAIANVLEKTDTMLNQISSKNLLNQRNQMAKNNEELAKYIQFKKKLEDRIQELEKENRKLRAARTSGVVAEPNYKPHAHKKQRIVNELHQQIFDSQKIYDQKVEEVNTINAKTQAIQHEVNEKVEKAERLQEERQNQHRKAASCKLQVPGKEDEKDKLQKEIAAGEERFQQQYSMLLKQLAEIKPIDIPEEMAQPPNKHPVYLDHLRRAR